jgi:hypothetical protein
VFTLGSFGENRISSPHFWANFSPVNSDKNGLGYILCDFFHKLIWSPWFYRQLHLKLRKMPLPKFVRDLKRSNAELLREQAIPVVGILDFRDDQLPPELALGVLAALRGRRRISLLASVRRQLVDGVVSLGELAARQRRRKVVFG